MYNDRLRPTHIWGGDIVDAHHAAVRVAAKTYCTPTFKDADVVVANPYPQNPQAFHGALWIDYSVREGGTGVLIVLHPQGLDLVHYLNNRLAGRSGATQFDLTARRVNGAGRAQETGNLSSIRNTSRGTCATTTARALSSTTNGRT